MLAIRITNAVVILPRELEIHAIRAQGPGGQNVNKVSTAIHLSFNVSQSSLPDLYKQRLLRAKGLTKNGVFIVKAQSYRSQDKNLKNACDRLRNWILKNTQVRKKRKNTKPSRTSVEKRLKHKKHKGQLKLARGKYCGD